jgi:hypothetical protein
VFLFRYDWRRSSAFNAERLYGFASLVQKKCRAQTISLVTHSLGALIVLAMLRAHREVLDMLDRAVLAAPPLMGTPMAVSSLVVGESGPLYFNSSTKFRRVARTCPSVHELVPFYEGAFRRDGEADTETSWDAMRWQRRVAYRFPEQKGEEDQRLTQLVRNLAGAKTFHANCVLALDEEPAAVRDKFTILCGTGVPTPDAIDIVAKNSAEDVVNFFDFSSFRAPDAAGDGTVPLVSTTRFGNAVRSIAIPVDVHSTWWDSSSLDDVAKVKLAGYHGAFLALDKNLSIVREILAGETILDDYIPGIRP